MSLRDPRLGRGEVTWERRGNEVAAPLYCYELPRIVRRARGRGAGVRGLREGRDRKGRGGHRGRKEKGHKGEKRHRRVRSGP